MSFPLRIRRKAWDNSGKRSDGKANYRYEVGENAVTQELHRKYAGARLLSELEKKIARLPLAQQRGWNKKYRALQQQAAPLLESAPASPLPLSPEQRIPSRLSSAE